MQVSFRASAALFVALLATTSIAVAADKSPGNAEEMQPYKQEIPGTEVGFEMLPIPGGEFLLGSPDSEADRKDDEGPQLKVKIKPFWMGKYEVTWDEYDIWSYRLDIQRRKLLGVKPTDLDAKSDAVTRPTGPYTDMTFGMGHDGYPAISMTQLAAKMYCEWLTEKTGHYYRLPTEAEWEYACRAGTKTAYSFGDSADDLDDHAWHYENSDEGYHKVGLKKPNPWGLYDMHGNVSEWVLDQYLPGAYKNFSASGKGDVLSPLSIPTTQYPRVVRGGSWDDDPDALRSAARHPSDKQWKYQDPQIPKSVWYHTDALHVGFRVVRPLEVPSKDEQKKLKLGPEEELLKEARKG
jgi:formylglycine-generating enzyme required for sulfatase activity